MKTNKFIAISLATSILISGCSSALNVSETEYSSSDSMVVTETATSVVDETVNESDETVINVTDEIAISSDYVDPNSFTGLNDENLLTYVEDMVYLNAVESINSSDYYVENVEAVYVSDEYLETLAANSQANIFFGHTEEELINQFEGTRFVFTLGPDGNTIVEEFVSNDELYGAYRQALTNMSIGTGVILVCVTVAVVAPAVGAPAAVTMVFSCAAAGATEMAIQSGVVGGTIGGIVEGVQTHNFDAALQAAAVSGSEGFMWGAIIGAVTGGVGELSWLRGAARETGLSINEIAEIQRISRYPLTVLRQINSTEEYTVLENARLRPTELNLELNSGDVTQSALIRDIDWNYTQDGVTNLERALSGHAPLDPTGQPYQLHHVGQHNDGILAILTGEEHRQIPNMVAESEIDREAFAATRSAFWRAMGNIASAA